MKDNPKPKLKISLFENMEERKGDSEKNNERDFIHDNCILIFVLRDEVV